MIRFRNSSTRIFPIGVRGKSVANWIDLINRFSSTNTPENKNPWSLVALAYGRNGQLTVSEI